MSSIDFISPDKLARLIGVAHCPAVIDVRTEEEYDADPRFAPETLRRPAATVSDWAPEFVGRSAIVVDANGKGSAEGVAAWLLRAGASSADVLNGGLDAWVKSDGAVVPEGTPKRDPEGLTNWVTRPVPRSTASLVHGSRAIFRP